MFLRKKKKNGLDKDKKVQRNSFDEEPEVDSEGYTIRKNVDNFNRKNLDKFYSSSDETDSEKEGEKKLHFEIKPRNGFDPKKSSVDELKKTVKQLSIGNVQMKENGKELISFFVNGTKRSNTSSNLISRCQSYSSLSTDLRMTPLSICSSRGPSPITLNNLGSSIPIAVAIQECVSARFKGSDETKCNCSIYGILKIAFPTGILQILMNQPLVSVLTFKLVNTARLSKMHCNKEVILNCQKNETNNEIQFDIKMDGLIQSLKQLFERSPAARYYNVDILKYQLETTPGTQSCPLQVVTHWKCEPQTTCLKIDYKYNPYALSSLEPLRNVSFSVKVDNVLDFQSKPQANWNAITKQFCWKIDQISRLSEGYGLGSLRAKFTVNKGPSSPAAVLIQMHCANSTFSGINFELLTSAYRVSVVKKQVSAGQYISEADSSISYVTV